MQNREQRRRMQNVHKANIWPPCSGFRTFGLFAMMSDSSASMSQRRTGNFSF